MRYNKGENVGWLCLLALLWFCFLPVMAQNQKVVTSGNVTGRVIDQNGDPLVGVSVYVKGSMAGTITDVKGYFEMPSHGKKELKKILLTASGGPFRGKKQEDLLNIRVEDALKHPNWAMGRKITIDSSSMVNKGLEVMEARWLFDVDIDDVQVVVQPQSVIHSMVEYVDGAVIAQLGTPDMKLPIQYALYYPDRKYLPGDRLDFWSLNQITFEKPDMENFPGLKLAFDAAAAGGSMPTVYNAANERAVAKFLDRKIGFLDIPEIISECMAAHKVVEVPTVEQILQTEAATYDMIESRW